MAHHMTTISFLLFILVVVMTAMLTEAFYFEIPAGQSVCFSEEFSHEATPVFMHYSVPNLASGESVAVRVADPTGTQRAFETSVKKEDTLSFTASNTVGAYSMCFTIPSASGPVKMYLEIDTHQQRHDETLAGKSLLEGYHAKAKQVLEAVRDVNDRTAHLVARHDRFQETSSSTYSRLMWWALLHIVIILATVAWQVTHLKTFFRQKKLV
eukprot:PhM_4_TR8554/c0_g1_i1/m.35234/K20346/TMED4_9_11; p24 family protein alpha